MTDTEALTDSSNYTQYLTLVHSDSFDKDEAGDKESQNTEQADSRLANGVYSSNIAQYRYTFVYIDCQTKSPDQVGLL